MPLYLEWAPRDIWAAPPAAAAAAAAAKKKAEAAAAAAAGGGAGAADVATLAGSAADAAAAARAAGEEEDEDGGAGPTAAIYVKNLNFATTDASLRRHFDKAASAAGARVLSAKVARRAAAGGKAPLSLGFGFVELDSQDAAKEVVKQLQGSMLDKHKLQLQLSKHKPGGAASDGKKGGKKKADDDAGAKLVVRNLAFEATRADVVGLFGPFGHLKSARLPKKFDGGHRGFAFVEFVTKQEAAAALEGVAGTHLYGRRLVVEYAQQGEEGLDELRAKAGARRRDADGEVGGEGAAAAKRLKRTL